MILELGAGASALTRATAALVLALHITGGGVGIASGGMALIARKGSRSHRRAGNWFFVSMLVMAAIGAIVAALLPQRASVIAGAFTFYLVSTAWITVKRHENEVGYLEFFAMLFALGIAAGSFSLGLMAFDRPEHTLDGLPAAPCFVFAALAALGASGDLRLILRHGISGGQRLARHLWRMCTALFIASFSFFLGQPQVFPPALRGSFLLYIPELVIVAALAFWMLRVSRVADQTQDQTAAVAD
jgi:hypothetical protein